MNPEDEKRDGGGAPRSDLEQGLEGLGNALTGLAAQLLGSKVVGRVPSRPAISPAADEAVRDLGDTVGRVLHAAGQALAEHPTEPGRAFRELREHATDPVEVAEGSAPLTEGLKSFATGLEKLAVGVLDVVAPKKPGAHPPPEGEATDHEKPQGEPAGG